MLPVEVLCFRETPNMALWVCSVRFRIMALSSLLCSLSAMFCVLFRVATVTRTARGRLRRGSCKVDNNDDIDDDGDAPH